MDRSSTKQPHIVPTDKAAESEQCADIFAQAELALAVLRVMISVDILAQANLAPWGSGAGYIGTPTPWSVQERTSREEWSSGQEL